MLSDGPRNLLAKSYSRPRSTHVHESHGRARSRCHARHCRRCRQKCARPPRPNPPAERALVSPELPPPIPVGARSSRLVAPIVDAKVIRLVVPVLP